MPRMTVTGDDLRRLSRDFKAAGRGDLARELTKGLRKAADPLKREVQEAVMRVDSKGVRGGGSRARLEAAAGRSRKPEAARARLSRRGTGLRRTVAGAVTTRVFASGAKAGVEIRIPQAKMPADQRKLPRYLDSTGGWRHPVFGNRDNWVRQTGSPYFYVTLSRRAPAVAGPRLVEAMETVARRLR